METPTTAIIFSENQTSAVFTVQVTKRFRWNRCVCRAVARGTDVMKMVGRQNIT